MTCQGRRPMLRKLKTAAIKEFSIAPGAMLLGLYAILSFVGVCLYWHFGTNDWIKIGLCPLWILSVAGLMQIALAIDVR